MKIMLVDDDPHSREPVADFLRFAGHNVVECEDGRRALEIFCGENFQLVLSDIKMPHLSGLELLRRLRQMPGGAAVGFILITGYGDLQTAVEALRAGANDFLLKPVNVEELAAATKRVTARCARLAGALGRGSALAESRNKPFDSGFNGWPGGIGVFSKAMADVFRKARKFWADRSVPVLIEGETGVGKEVVARYIHWSGGRSAGPFVDINCAAIPASIFESELFGYEGGTFTGSLPGGRKGKLDLACGGTIFLDEIAELSPEMQAKLLRVIQEKEYYRVGGLKKIGVDVRVICATNADVLRRVQEGRFRSDLYYRLNVGRLYIPPLRERREEILPLTEMFLRHFSAARQRRFQRVSPAAAEILLSYPWPGNVKELKNTVDRVTLLWDGEEVKPSHLELPAANSHILPPGSALPVLDPNNFALPPGGLPLEEFTNRIIEAALKKSGGNKTLAARYLGISRRSLYCRLKRICLKE